MAAKPVTLVGPNGFGRHAEKMHDLAMTGRAVQLLAVPRHERNDRWLAEFLPALWHASLAMPDDPADRVFDASIGFPHVRLAIPPSGQRFEAYCVAGVLRYCLENGLGIALFSDLNDAPDKAVFALSTGQLDSLYRFGTINGDPEHRADLKPGVNAITLEKSITVLHATPAPSVLPPYIAGAMLRQMRVGWKMAEPRASLVVFPDSPAEQTIMVNATFCDLPVDPGVAKMAFSCLQFYMPGHLVLMPLIRPDMEAHMTPLADLAAVPVEWDTVN